MRTRRFRTPAKPIGLSASGAATIGWHSVGRGRPTVRGQWPCGGLHDLLERVEGQYALGLGPIEDTIDSDDGIRHSTRDARPAGTRRGAVGHHEPIYIGHMTEGRRRRWDLPIGRVAT